MASLCSTMVNPNLSRLTKKQSHHLALQTTLLRRRMLAPENGKIFLHTASCMTSHLLEYSIMYDKSQDEVTEAETGTTKRLASLSRSSLLTLTRSNSKTSSSISSEENELPEQFHTAPLKMPTPHLGSYAPKTSSISARSFWMMDLHRLHGSSSSVHLKDKQKAD